MQTADSITSKEFEKGVSRSLATMPRGSYAAAATAYRREDLLNLSPVEVIKKLYDIAILACKKNDLNLAQRAISELIVGLNFDHGEISVGLFRLYRYVKNCLQIGNVDEATNVLQELQAAWVEAFHL